VVGSGELGATITYGRKILCGSFFPWIYRTALAVRKKVPGLSSLLRNVVVCFSSYMFYVEVLEVALVDGRRASLLFRKVFRAAQLG
jgi:hypothetical protein